MTSQAVLLAVFLAQALSVRTQNNEVCLGELGCIPRNDCPSRLLNFEPDAREVINTKFLFYSRKSRSVSYGQVPDLEISGYRMKPTVLPSSAFNPKRLTKFIVHGWLDNPSRVKWMTALKDALLRNGDFNVILVDWRGGNRLDYLQAARNTRVVGAEIGLLIKKLMDTFGISPSSVHVYGHSLGGHVAGYAGKWLNGTLGRITSMDPAQPYFEFCPPVARLSKTDAQFVEVFHTDSAPFVPRLGLGMDLAVGDVDFYPNGGRMMPGCGLTGRLQDLMKGNILEKGQSFAACNHLRAIEYTRTFLENSADHSSCIPIAFACRDYESFERGHCYDCGHDGSRCAIMTLEGAEYARSTREKDYVSSRMYFKTGAHPPFCLYHYHIEMKLKNGAMEPVSGSLSVRINTMRGKYFTFDLEHGSSDGYFTPGETYRYLITSEEAIEDVEWLTFTYKSWRRIWPPELYLEHLKFTRMTATNPGIDLEKISQTFCTSGRAVKSRTPTNFEERFC